MARVCDDCPEHSEIKKVQADRDLEQAKQWQKIEDIEKCANAAKREATKKVGPTFVVLVLGIVLTVCGIGFKVIYEQNSRIGGKVEGVKERVIAIETKLKERDRWEGRNQGN